MVRITVAGRGRSAGFTLMELLLVMLLVALLAGIAVPVVTTAIVRAKEAAVRENLRIMRTAIDDYYTDKGAYPPELEQLVVERYIRGIPSDPLADGHEQWLVVYGEDGGVTDVRSRSEKTASDGSVYANW